MLVAFSRPSFALREVLALLPFSDELVKAVPLVLLMQRVKPGEVDVAAVHDVDGPGLRGHQRLKGDPRISHRHCDADPLTLAARPSPPSQTERYFHPIRGQRTRSPPRMMKKPKTSKAAPARIIFGMGTSPEE